MSTTKRRAHPIGNDSDWSKVATIEVFIAMARKNDPRALERLVEAYEVVICPANTMAKIRELAGAIEDYGARLRGEPARHAEWTARRALICFENVDSRFRRLGPTEVVNLLRRYDPNKKLHGIDGILATMVDDTGALDLDIDAKGERRQSEDIRRHIASVLVRLARKH
jgi:hypothetical protein